MKKIKITFDNGLIREYSQPVTGLQLVEENNLENGKEALAIEVNGEFWDLSRKIENDASVRFLSWNDAEGKRIFWHSSAHLLAGAIETLFPGTKFGTGPAIEDGFYYDVDMGDYKLSQDDLLRIEETMFKFVEQNTPYIREEKSWDEAIEYFRQKGDTYKIELLEELKGQKISLYRHGNFIDLCSGPHIPSTGLIKALKILNVSGAYWRGCEKNKMLQRVYGISFPTKAELDNYLHRLDEAKRRDHRKLGKELGLFVFHDISPGAPFWLPNGMIIFRELEKLIREELDQRGYQEISTPILVKKDLWEQSGHWTHYRENMFYFECDNTTYSLKPMNCPESTYVYKNSLRSYKELPLRFSEIGRLHRNELSGAIGGMFRVRQITMDDAHIYCTPEQILDEIQELIDLVNKIYSIFGLSPVFNLSTKPVNAMGDPKLWACAEESLKTALERKGIPYTVKPKEGAFYGPKIDIQIQDVLGRDWQVATIQLDLVMLPERFELEYISADGSRQRPVVIHRAILGSFERFVGIITEHFAGEFPVWLSPVQVVILPITTDQIEYSKSILGELRESKVRAELDDRREKIGYKIREWELKKVPYMLIIGEKESKNRNVSLRQHKKGDLGIMALSEFIEKIKLEIANKSLTT